MIPEIAILGHPNEGKSSVLSTLAEDDSVRISPYPGETTVCRTFPVIIDNREILRLTDTPGFQNPGRILAAFKTFTGSSEARLRQLLEYSGTGEDLAEDHELLKPIAKGAGIIYVVNGARPLRQVDRDEMEIIRLTGKPRMAVINCKEDEEQYLPQWKDELARHFNLSRLFNAHRATYSERLGLLEALKSIDQDWEQVLEEVVETIRQDWDNRTRTTAHLIASLTTESLSLNISANLKPGTEEQSTRIKLIEKYTSKITDLETRAHAQIRSLFNHNLYNYELPPYSILHEDIFSERTWQFMGLSKKQFIILGGLGGGALGAGIDVAALGHGLGLFTALGTIGGALGAISGRKHFDYQASLLGLQISGPQMIIGPAGSISLLFVLINRSLHFYKHMANWSHGRRDYDKKPDSLQETVTSNYTRNWSAAQLKLCHDFFKTAERPESEKHQSASVKLEEILVSTLTDISSSNSER